MPDPEPIEASGAEVIPPPAEPEAPAAEPVPIPEPEAPEVDPSGCSCGVGAKPKAYHDDECAVWEGAYERSSIEPADLPERSGAVGSALADLPVVPQASEMNSIAQLAVTLAAAGACPSAIRGKPNDVFLVLLSARDLGVSLTTAMREFHVIEGKVTLSPKVKLALVRQSGLGKIWPDAENGPEKATWHTERNDLPGHPISSTFSWADAQLAHLVDSRCTPYEHWRASGGGRNSAECLCKSNWKTYPARMLSWRAAGYLLDDVYPEVGTGLYAPDEIGAVTDADGEPIEVRAVESLPGMRGGQRAGGGGGGQPEPEKISSEKAEQLRERTGRAKAHPEAKPDLAAWWSEREFPKVEDLTEGQARILEAKLAQLESVYKLADGPLAGGEAQGGEEGDPPQPPSEEPAEAPGATEAPIPPAQPEPEEDPAAPIEEPEDPPEPPACPPAAEVASWVREEAAAMSGPALKTSWTLAGLKPPPGNTAMLRLLWSEWQLQLAAAGEPSVLIGCDLAPESIEAALAEIRAEAEAAG